MKPSSTLERPPLFGRSRRLWGGGQQMYSSTHKSRLATRVSRPSFSSAPTARRGRSGARHLRTSPRKSPPASSLACAAHPGLVPVRGARISRCLPTRLRRSYKPCFCQTNARKISATMGAIKWPSRAEPPLCGAPQPHSVCSLPWRCGGMHGQVLPPCTHAVAPVLPPRVGSARVLQVNIAANA